MSARSREDAVSTRPAASTRRSSESVAGTHGGDDRVEHRLDLVVDEVRAQAEQVDTGGQGPHGGGRDADLPAGPLHVQGVADQQPLEPESAVALGRAEQLRGHRAERRGLARIQRPHDDVGGHHRHRLGGDPRSEGHQLPRPQDLDGGFRHRQGDVGVGDRVAVSGEVLEAGADPGGLQPFDERRHVARHQLRLRAEAADPDDRVERVGVDVGHGGEVQVHAEARSSEPMSWATARVRVG